MRDTCTTERFMLPNFHRSFESEEKKEFLCSPCDQKIERIRRRSVSLSVESHWSIIIFHGGFFGPAISFARNCLMKPPRLGTAWKEGRNVAVGQGETPAFTSSRQPARVPRERLPSLFFPSPSVVLLPVRMFLSAYDYA